MIHGLVEKGHQTAADAGIRIAGIEAAEFLQRRGHRAGDIRLGGRILDQGNRPSTCGTNRRHGRFNLGGAVQRDDRRAFGGEQQSARAADAACGAGDDGRFAFQCVHERQYRRMFQRPATNGENACANWTVGRFIGMPNSTACSIPGMFASSAPLPSPGPSAKGC